MGQFSGPEIAVDGRSFLFWAALDRHSLTAWTGRDTKKNPGIVSLGYALKEMKMLADSYQENRRRERCLSRWSKSCVPSGSRESRGLDKFGSNGLFMNAGGRPVHIPSSKAGRC